MHWDASRALIAGAAFAVTSDLSTLECLVGPIRQGDSVTEASYRFLFGLQLGTLAIEPSVLRRAAELRAAYRFLRTPDAIHAATALENGCAEFVTNDAAFAKVAGLTVRMV